MKKTTNTDMKQKSNAKTSVKKFLLSTIVVVSTFSMILAGPLSMQKPVYADRFDDQIEAIQNEINGFESAAGKLQSKANSLSNALHVLGNQKAAIQAKIDLSQAKYAKLTAEIKKTEKDITNNQGVLGSTVADLYVDSSLTPLEMLASSKSIGDYVDKQEYRSAVREQLEAAITHIKDLKQKLVAQKTDVEHVLARQKQQRGDLAAKENERANLLAKTHGQEQQYRSMIAQRGSEIAKVRQEQEAAYAAYNSSHGGSVAVPGDPSHGGYPAVWANAAQDSIVDDWGMYNRECVSYVAWRIYHSGKDMPPWGSGGNGNAYQWVSNARSGDSRSRGITIARGQPKAHTAVVWDQNAGMGYYGHVAYVERVNGDGSIWVSQYNFTHGSYSEMPVSAGEVSGLYFISFPSN